MTFQKGQSGNPSGRPPGARNKATLLAEQLLDGEVEVITRTLIDMAKDGDTTALRLCLDRLLPARKERTIEFELPPLTCAADAVAALSAIAAAVAGGELTPGEAADLMKLVDVYARTLDIATFEARLRKVEETARQQAAALEKAS